MSEQRNRLAEILAAAWRLDEEEAVRVEAVERNEAADRVKADQFLSLFHERRALVLVPTLQLLRNQLAAGGHDCRIEDHSNDEVPCPRINFMVTPRRKKWGGERGYLSFACLASRALSWCWIRRCTRASL